MTNEEKLNIWAFRIGQTIGALELIINQTQEVKTSNDLKKVLVSIAETAGELFYEEQTK